MTERHVEPAVLGRYVDGLLDDRRRTLVSQHLLSCDSCWESVQAATRGRALAESARTVAPAVLRDRVRAHLLAEPARRRPRRWAGAVAAAAALAVLATVVLLPRGDRSGAGTEPPALAAAVADFRSASLPGRRVPVAGSPDLARLGLQPVGAAGGSYGSLAVDGYAYRDGAGGRVVVYRSPSPFPRPPGARELAGAAGPWTARDGGVAMLCASSPQPLLVVGQDVGRVREVARALGVREA